MTHAHAHQDAGVEGFPFRRGCPMHPPAEYDELRTRDTPAVRTRLASGRAAWLVSGYAPIRRVLADPRVSSNLAHPGYPLQFDAPVEVLEQMRPVLLAADPPDHTAQRRLVAGEFTARRIRALRPRIEQVVDDHLDALAAHGGSADLVDALAIPVPSLVICELLGIPDADRSAFQDRTKLLVAVDADPIARQQAHQELSAYFAGVVDGSTPTDDGLLRRLVAENAETGTLDHTQLVGLATVLLVGGHETTANMIGLGVLTLLEHPEQRDALVADPGRAGAVVDELLRYWSIADQVTARVALDDVALDGVTIPAGDGIIALTASGNHDERVFEDPHRFDTDRPTRSHLAFGHGIHQCIGQHLAKVELEVVLVRLLRRFPGLRLAVAVEELPFKDPLGVYGLHRLPVTW